MTEQQIRTAEAEALPVAAEQPAEEIFTEQESVKCEFCGLNQFVTVAAACRRCKRSLVPEPESVPGTLLQMPNPPSAADDPFSHVDNVAAAVRNLRISLNLSQRQLAERMKVPRTYVSKIENCKATPTLTSLQRFAVALRVDVAVLVSPAAARSWLQTTLHADPFLAALSTYLPSLDFNQKSVLMSHAKELAQMRKPEADVRPLGGGR